MTRHCQIGDCDRGASLVTYCRLGECAAPATHVVWLVLARELAASIVVCEEHARQIMALNWGLSLEVLPGE